jgi:hypothetical protein
MPMVALALPISTGQTETFRNAYQRFVADRRVEFEQSRQRLGVRSERGFLQHTASADLAIVVFEVEDVPRLFAGVGSSDAPLDVEFRSYLRQVFGLDLTRPPPAPPAEPVFDWRAGEGG